MQSWATVPAARLELEKHPEQQGGTPAEENFPLPGSIEKFKQEASCGRPEMIQGGH